MNVDAVEAGFPGLDRVPPSSPQWILRNQDLFEPQDAAEIELRGLSRVSILVARMPRLIHPALWRVKQIVSWGRIFQLGDVGNRGRDGDMGAGRIERPHGLAHSKIV
jgi:hypothetical protein